MGSELLQELQVISRHLNLNAKPPSQTLEEIAAESETSKKLLEIVIAYKEGKEIHTEGGTTQPPASEEWKEVEEKSEDVALRVLEAAAKMEQLTLEGLIAKAGLKMPEVQLEAAFMDDGSLPCLALH